MSKQVACPKHGIVDAPCYECAKEFAAQFPRVVPSPADPIAAEAREMVEQYSLAGMRPWLSVPERRLLEREITAFGHRMKSAGRAEEKELTMKIGNREVKVREDSTPFCAFCGKARAEGKRIINGPTVGICNDCIELLASMIGIERSPQGPARPAEASAWRPISEVQPRDVVLVWDNGTLSRDPGVKVWRAGSQKITTPGITHFMPLPTPPEGGE